MKRGNSGAIASLFQKHEAKRIAAVVIDVQAEGNLCLGSENLLQLSDSAPQFETDSAPQSETDSAPPSPHLPSGSSADTYLPFDCDPGKRIPISSYDVNDQDDVRRRYNAKGGYRSYSHDFEVRLMYGKNRQTNDDHFRRQVYLGVVDQVIQELDNRFDEVNMELLVCMSCLNPTNSFAAYDATKVMRLAEFYPKDISHTDLTRLEFQLGTFIDDMRQDNRFQCLKTLGELSIKLVETQKHVLYDLVYRLLKLVLVLPVATASVERVFSAMSLVKNKLRNSLGDDLLNYCLVTFIERELFLEVKEEDIVGSFMAMRRRRVDS